MLVINIILLSLIVSIAINFRKKSQLLSCGLIGFSAFEGKESDPDAIRILMLANMKRGSDATGIFYGEEIIKETDIVDVFLSKNDIEPSSVFVGHVRNASVGNKTVKKNAHPFERDGIIGAHNGTLKNWTELANKINISHKDVFVDSDLIFKAIATHKNTDNPYQILEKANGAVTIIWADRENLNHIYVYREGQRPLYTGVTEDGRYFSSTKESLMLIRAESITIVPTNKVYCYINGKLSEENSKLVNNVPYYGYNNHNYQFYNTFNNTPKTTSKQEYYILTKHLSVFSDSKAGDVVQVDSVPDSKGLKRIIHNTNNTYSSVSRKIEDDEFRKLIDVEVNQFVVIIDNVNVYDDKGDIEVLEKGQLLFATEIEDVYRQTFVTCTSLEDNLEYEIDAEFLRGIDYTDYGEIYVESTESLQKIIDPFDVETKKNKSSEDEKEQSKSNVYERNDDESDEDLEGAPTDQLRTLFTEANAAISSSGFEIERISFFVEEVINHVSGNIDLKNLELLKEKVDYIEESLNDMLLTMVDLNESLVKEFDKLSKLEEI